MKKFELPNISLVYLNSEDVIVTSTLTNKQMGDDLPGQTNVDFDEIF